MKNFVRRFQVSSALDDRRSLPPDLQRRLEDSDDLRAFAETTARIGRTLRQAVPAVQAPAGLHGSIMSAVHASDASRPFAWPSWVFRLAAPALALVLGAGLWLNDRLPAPRSSAATVADWPALSGGPAALALGRQAVASPGMMVAPLSEELDRVNQDLQSVTRTLLAVLR